MNRALVPEHFDKIEKILQMGLIDLGVHCAVLLDTAGNIVTDMDNGMVKFDVYSLAALAAANFGAVNTLARIIGEQDIFLLFYKGKKESIYFSKVLEEFLLVTLFGHDLSLGFIRLKVAEATAKIAAALKP